MRVLQAGATGVTDQRRIPLQLAAGHDTYHHASQQRLGSEFAVTRLGPGRRYLRLVDGAPASPLPEGAAAEAEHERPWATLRPLPPTPIVSLAEYRAGGGLRGLEIATASAPAEITATLLDSGLQGRGGAGFPAGRKWQTVAGKTASGHPADVVVNGAEGEPGTFKDRSILRRNPYLVIEGAFIAARAVGADRVIIAMKASFTEEVARTRDALAELRAVDALPTNIACAVFEGPDEYLYGEETALLETIGGGGPFPRNAPPYRVGLLDLHRRPAAGPALVNNVETIANVPAIVARGAGWFRTIGTPESPGSVVCTVSGDVRKAGVGEVPMGVPLRRVLDDIGGGPLGPVKAVLSGVANPVILEEHLDQPVSHEAMRAAGCGLGSAGFIVFAHPADMVAVAAGIARFLAIESCGQCTPCKTDGAELAALLERLALSRARAADLETIERRIGTVDYGARCYLGSQQATVLASIHERFRSEFEDHLTGSAPPAEPVLIAELLDIRDGEAVIDERHRRKQPDWTYGRMSSGAAPADRKIRHRSTSLQLTPQELRT